MHNRSHSDHNSLLRSLFEVKEIMTRFTKEKDPILIAHQGELDAVKMYTTLEKMVRADNPELADAFRDAARDEGKHAAICKAITGRTDLKANPMNAIAVSALYRFVSRKLALKLISGGELKAAKDYALYILEYPTLMQPLQDDVKHGTIMKSWSARV